MSQYDYSPLITKVQTLIDKFGTHDCRIMRPGAGNPDALKPWKPDGATPDQIIATGVSVVPDNVSFRRGKYNAAQALTESGRGKAYAAAVVDRLEPGDWLDIPDGFGGWVTFAISRAEAVAPGGTTVLWELTLRS